MNDQEPLDQELSGSPYASTMKTTAVLIGWGIFVVGFLFKIQHWPGGGPLIILAVAIMIIAPIIQLIQTFREPDSTFRFGAILRFAMAPWMLSYLFRVQHWPGTVFIFVLALLLTVFSGILVSKTAYKRSRWLIPAILMIVLGVSRFLRTEYGIF